MSVGSWGTSDGPRSRSPWGDRSPSHWWTPGLRTAILSVSDIHLVKRRPESPGSLSLERRVRRKPAGEPHVDRGAAPVGLLHVGAKVLDARRHLPVCLQRSGDSFVRLLPERVFIDREDPAVSDDDLARDQYHPYQGGRIAVDEV